MTLEHSIARLLTIGTYAGVGALALGVVLMLVEGRSPLDPSYPPFDLATLPADLVALHAAGWLWLGIVLLLATPIARVAAALVGFVSTGERRMALVSVAILGVLGLGILLGATGG